jgi:hypothetical protein
MDRIAPTGTRNRIRRAAVALCALSAVVLSLPSPAGANPPVRSPSPLPTGPFPLTDTLGNDPCGFPVLVDITANKEVVSTFTRRTGLTLIHTTGALKVTLTNAATEKSIDRNISGPILATVNDDGSITQKGTGPALWAFDPGVAPELPRMVIVKGQSESVLGPGNAFQFTSWQGSYEDICAALAP